MEQLRNPARPIVYISWFEAEAFCVWAGCRLATEAEWEGAARGPGQDYRKYPWGNAVPTPDLCNYDATKIGHPTPPGIFPAGNSAEEISDLAGNVWEWCMDWHSAAYYKECFKNGACKDPVGHLKGDDRVVRGGSFLDDANRLRCSDRSYWVPGHRSRWLGFRVVRVGRSK